MARRYRPVERDQQFLLPPDMREWLPADDPVWLVIRVVEQHLDTSAFHAARRTGGRGAAGYDPDMLVTVLVWAYAHQVTSSRRIERLCRTDVAFRVICGGSTPRHVTISEFRRAFPLLAGEFFGQVLVLCARLGMGQLGVVALDGTKIAANASKSANRTEQSLRKMAADTAARHGETDAAEDALFGAAAGDEVPEAAWRPGSRDERIAAALASLAAERAAAGAEQAAGQASRVADARAGTPRPGRRPAGAAAELAALKLERARAARAAQLAALEQRQAAGQPRRGRAAGIDDYCRVRQARAELGQAQAAAAAGQDNDNDPGGGSQGGSSGQEKKAKGKKEPVRNITDPDSRLMPVRGGGFLQGYNPQNVTSADGLVIATELTNDPADCAWFEPMLRRAEDAAALITAHRPAPPDPARGPPAGQDASLIGLILTDAGYLSEHNLTLAGPDRLIATGKTRDLEKAARDSTTTRTWASEPIAGMAARLATSEGITAYRQRSHIAETPHGHIKHNMRFRQLTMRGKPKAAAEWDFTCGVHNLLKAITTGHLTTAALDRLAAQPA